MEPGQVTLAGLCAYLGYMDRDTVLVLVETRFLPAPSNGHPPSGTRARWDLASVDKALDAAAKGRRASADLTLYGRQSRKRWPT